jgi:hypothetical protein
MGLKKYKRKMAPYLKETRSNKKRVKSREKKPQKRHKKGIRKHIINLKWCIKKTIDKIVNFFLSLITIIVFFVMLFYMTASTFYMIGYSGVDVMRNFDTMDKPIAMFDEYEKKRSMESLEHLNEIRKEKDRRPLEWNDNLYELALFRVKDLHKRNYFDHVTPEGKCVEHFRRDYEIFTPVAENLAEGETSRKSAINGWMTSRGHRYNLLYHGHKSGVIAKYGNKYIFLGTGSGDFGRGCNTGEEGLVFWEEADIQSGEI